ncbi:hypothetical protein DOTSEDRAFT_71785 [Dothistroma septosporum NZE10]|uniref:Uncharacterized protein n=1 Tax=Dothistroma septosporum (strain NZE10 / CBS 128990) TaxID=675120 RepID=N1PM63_DOTSN|nr:hypothetical protein DOTSEDRAFT_71785 [Dothistroma septosporum NZE10]
MGPRPANLDLGQHRPDAFEPPKMFAHRDLPSPRTGEIPPALSPLDAFAMQSRALQKKFKEQQENGRRMSRLPPMLVQKEISNRPGYFRSMSGESKMTDLLEGDEDSMPVSTHGKTPETGLTDQRPMNERPVSYYPRFSTATEPDEEQPPVPTPFFDALEQRASTPQQAAKAAADYFGISAPRASSPEPVDSTFVNVQAPSPNDYPSLTNSIDTISSHPRTMTIDSQRSHRSNTQTSERGLAVPLSPRWPRSPRSFQSIRSVPPDSGDEDGASITGSHAVSSSRKFSGSSGVSRPQSPFSPWMQPVHRSPSMTSEYSMNGTQTLQRPVPNFSNFSRPMSSSGSRPSFEGRASLEKRPVLPTRQASGASSSTEHSSKSPLSRQASADDHDGYHNGAFSDIHTPALLESSRSEFAFPPGRPSDDSGSYIYAKYALPRGRHIDRDSQAFRDSWIQKQFKWDMEHGSARPAQHERTHSDSPALEQAREKARERVAKAQAGLRTQAPEASRSGRTLAAAPSEIRSQSVDPRALEKVRSEGTHRSSPSVKTTSTDHTIKARPLHHKSPSSDLTPEEHLEIGIRCHELGETNKSTYHLRLAALAGVPTGMLLYAMACRHGWGMRENPEEGVRWLRKAVDITGLDVADAEEGLKTLDLAERKKRKAQFALAIYELGTSARHGWGCPKDKALAVRCFEIAGSWGDADALAEAGYCYTEGVGVKKDYKKAASFYRQAEKKGVSMAGNSWIYKEKYQDETEAQPKAPDTPKKRPGTSHSKTEKTEERESRKDDKPAGRQRSRSIWGRSKKEKPPALPL